MPYARDIDTKMVNEAILRGLTSDDTHLRKEAQANTTDYLRIRMREDGFARRIFDPVQVTAADLDRQVDTPKPVIVRDMEPNSAGAYSLPFGTTPSDTNILGPRYRVMFDRIESDRYTAEKNNLLTYDYDIKQLLNDFILKDIMGEEDYKTMLVVDGSIVGTLNTPIADLGSCLNLTVGALDRQSLAHAMKGLPSTNRHLSPAKALVNNVTIWDVVALTREEVGGDLAEELFVNGYAERKVMGLPWGVTIKTDLVADNVVYQFAEPKFLGDFFILDDITMSTKIEDYMLSFFAYECIGATIQNRAAVAKVSFTGTQRDWRTGA